MALLPPKTKEKALPNILDYFEWAKLASMSKEDKIPKELEKFYSEADKLGGFFEHVLKPVTDIVYKELYELKMEEKIKWKAIYKHFWKKLRRYHFDSSRELCEALQNMGYREDEAYDIAFSYLIGHIVSHNRAKLNEEDGINNLSDKTAKYITENIINNYLRERYEIDFKDYTKEPDKAIKEIENNLQLIIYASSY